MPSHPAAEIETKMRLLRLRYLEQLEERRIELEAFEAAAQWNGNERATLRMMAHKLAGSGKTYGFSAISETAKALEEKILANDKDLSSHLQALIRSINEAQEQNVENDLPETGEIIPLHPKKDLPLLLLIDDDPDITALIQSLFTDKAHVRTVDNAEAALEIMHETRPDLVFLDDQMPGLTGLELIERLEKDKELKDIPVIMLTASAEPEKVMRGLVAGAIDYITKPFDPNLLLEKAHKRLARRKNLILIADDDPPVLDLLVYKFKNAGCRVLAARDGSEALAFMQDQTPDLVLLDRLMPGEDGIAVYQKIQANERLSGIPVVFLTVKHNESDILGALDMGAADYIVKPFSADEVVTRCLRLLRKKEGAE
jgi:DNA-binding response OmpR family regulator